MLLKHFLLTNAWFMLLRASNDFYEISGHSGSCQLENNMRGIAHSRHVTLNMSNALIAFF